MWLILKGKRGLIVRIEENMIGVSGGDEKMGILMAVCLFSAERKGVLIVRLVHPAIINI